MVVHNPYIAIFTFFNCPFHILDYCKGLLNTNTYDIKERKSKNVLFILTIFGDRL